jgi:hypothetical protein
VTKTEIGITVELDIAASAAVTQRRKEDPMSNHRDPVALAAHEAMLKRNEDAAQKNGERLAKAAEERTAKLHGHKPAAVQPEPTEAVEKVWPAGWVAALKKGE